MVGSILDFSFSNKDVNGQVNPVPQIFHRKHGLASWDVTVRRKQSIGLAESKPPC